MSTIAGLAGTAHLIRHVIRDLRPTGRIGNRTRRLSLACGSRKRVGPSAGRQTAVATLIRAKYRAAAGRHHLRAAEMDVQDLSSRRRVAVNRLRDRDDLSARHFKRVICFELDPIFPSKTRFWTLCFSRPPARKIKLSGKQKTSTREGPALSAESAHRLASKANRGMWIGSQSGCGLLEE